MCGGKDDFSCCVLQDVGKLCADLGFSGQALGWNCPGPKEVVLAHLHLGTIGLSCAHMVLDQYSCACNDHNRKKVPYICPFRSRGTLDNFPKAFRKMPTSSREAGRTHYRFPRSFAGKAMKLRRQSIAAVGEVPCRLSCLQVF